MLSQAYEAREETVSLFRSGCTQESNLALAI